MYKWRIVLGGVASACFLGTFAAGPAFASAASPYQGPVASQSAELPGAGQLLPGALNAVTSLPPMAAVTGPVSSIVSNLGQGTSAPGTPNLTGVLPAVGSGTDALLNGVGNTTQNLSGTLLPAVGPAVGGLTAPVDGVSQDLGNLAGVPVLGPLISSVPALPHTGDLLGDLNTLVNGAGHIGG